MDYYFNIAFTVIPFCVAFCMILIAWYCKVKKHIISFFETKGTCIDNYKFHFLKLTIIDNGTVRDSVGWWFEIRSNFDASSKYRVAATLSGKVIEF